jgi:hypothetical protein
MLSNLYLTLIPILTYLIPQRATSPLIIARSICHQQSTDRRLHFRLRHPSRRGRRHGVVRYLVSSAALCTSLDSQPALKTDGKNLTPTCSVFYFVPSISVFVGSRFDFSVRFCGDPVFIRI